MERRWIQELSVILTEKNGLSKKDATRFSQLVFDTIKEGLESDGNVKVKGLGTFKFVDIGSRESINVNTGERVLIHAHSKISFIPDATMKELVNKPFSQFETVVLNNGIEFDDLTEDDVACSENEDDISEEEISQTFSGSDSPDEINVPHKQNEVKEILDNFPERQDSNSLGHSSVVTISSSESNPGFDQGNDLIDKDDLANMPILEFVDSENKELAEGNQESDSEELTSTISFASKTSQWGKLLTVSLVSFLIGIFVGCFVKSTQHQKIDLRATSSHVNIPSKMQKDPIVPGSLLKKSIIASEQQDSIVNTTAVQKKAPEKEINDNKENDRLTVDKNIFAMKDVRVRTGAYVIVGLDYVVKVRSGDTMDKISKRTLGPDMNCYIEVFNDLKPNSELSVGQEIKIPKLQLKKKKQ